MSTTSTPNRANITDTKRSRNNLGLSVAMLRWLLVLQQAVVWTTERPSLKGSNQGGLRMLRTRSAHSSSRPTPHRSTKVAAPKNNHQLQLLKLPMISLSNRSALLSALLNKLMVRRSGPRKTLNPLGADIKNQVAVSKVPKSTAALRDRPLQWLTMKQLPSITQKNKLAHNRPTKNPPRPARKTTEWKESSALKKANVSSRKARRSNVKIESKGESKSRP